MSTYIVCKHNYWGRTEKDALARSLDHALHVGVQLEVNLVEGFA